MQKIKNQKMALIIGFVLISLVGLVAFRNSSQHKKDIQDLEKLVQEKEAKKKNIKFKILSIDKFQEKMIKNDNYEIIDIRNEEDYQKKHLLGSLNIPTDNFSSQTELEIDASSDIILVAYGISEELLKKTVNVLSNEGFTNIFVLGGKILDWEKLQGKILSKGDPYSLVDQSKVDLVLASEVKEYLDNHQFLFIVDTRPSQDFLKGHIPQAINVPFDEIEKKHQELPINISMVIYGKNELETFQSTVRLFDLGYFSVSAIKDGFEDWQKRNYAIEKGEGRK